MAIVLFHDVEIAAPGANTDFGTVTPGRGAHTLRVSVNLATSSVFKARVGDGTDTNDEDFNLGVALVAGSTYVFDLPLPAYTTNSTPAAMTCAFQVETDSVINRLCVLGLQAGEG